MIYHKNSDRMRMSHKQPGSYILTLKSTRTNSPPTNRDVIVYATTVVPCPAGNYVRTTSLQTRKQDSQGIESYEETIRVTVRGASNSKLTKRSVWNAAGENKTEMLAWSNVCSEQSASWERSSSPKTSPRRSCNPWAHQFENYCERCVHLLRFPYLLRIRHIPWEEDAWI